MSSTQAACRSDANLSRVCIAFSRFSIHEQIKALFKAEAFEAVVGTALFVQRFGHPGEAKGFEPVGCRMCQQGSFSFSQ